MVVPAGALAQTVDLKITEIAPASATLPAGRERVSAVYALTPHGTAFAAPVTVTLPFNGSQVAADREPQFLKTTDDARSNWSPVEPPTVNGSQVSVQIDSLSDAFVSMVPTTPFVVIHPADIEVAPGAVATFSVTADSRSGGPLQYQWQRNGFDIDSENEASFELPSAELDDHNALYSVLVSNDVGTISSLQGILTVTAVLPRGAVDVVSLDANGDFGSANSGLTSSVPALSEDGRYVAFMSLAPLLPGAGCGIYLRDMEQEITQLITVKLDGSPSPSPTPCNSVPSEVAITPDARYVAFTINRTDLVEPPLLAAATHAYVRDTCIGAVNACTPTTVRVSIDNGGNLLSSVLITNISISDDGRYVAFVSGQRAFVHDRDNDGNGIYDERLAFPNQPGPYNSFVVSHSINSAQVWASQPMISGNGRHVVYIAETDLVECSERGVTGICTFVHDRDANGDGVFDDPAPAVTWTNVSLNNAEEIAVDGQVVRPWISRDGRIVSFRTTATNMGTDGTQFPRYAHDRDVAGTGTFDTPGNRLTVLATVDANGQQIAALVSDPMQGFGHSGRFMLLVGPGNWALPNATNPNASQVFLRDLCIGAKVPSGCTPSTVRLSVRDDGTLPTGSTALGAALSPDARRVAFGQTAGSLVDLNGDGTRDTHSIWQIYRGSTGTGELIPEGQNTVTVIVSGPADSGFVSGPFGNGSGGTRCDPGETCFLAVPEGAYAILFPLPAPGFTFAGWTGPCQAGADPSACWGFSTGNPTFTATFE